MHRDTLPARRRYTRLAGSADALAIARLAAAEKPLAVVTATALDAQRLVDEIAWFAPPLRVCLLPDWETLPYDQFSPHQDLVSERLATLYRIQRGDFDIAVVPAPTALVRLCPPAYIAARSFFLKVGERLSLDSLRQQLSVAGYNHVTQVVAPGEACFRGGLIDLFPMGSTLPYRIDLDDNVIDSIKTFDVDSQRTLYAVSEVRLLPAREFPLDEAGRARFRSRWRELFEGDPSKKSLYRDVSSGIAAAGIEYYLPLFFESAATLFDYLPKDCTVALHHDVSEAIQGFWRDASSRYKLLGGDPDRPLLAPPALFVPAEEFYLRLREHPRIDYSAAAAEDDDGGGLVAALLPSVAVDRRAQEPLAALKRFLDSSALRVLVTAESPGRRETMANYFGEYGLKPAPCASFEQFQRSPASFLLGVSPLAQGFALAAEGWAIVTESELYAGVVRRRARATEKRSSVEGMLRDLSELKVGDPVVHEQHGIGRFQGLMNLALAEGQSEFLLLQYEGGDKLYVPVSQLGMIGRYSGAQPEEAPLHKLGSGQWDKAKARAAKQVRDTAAELLALYARRAARHGHAFGIQQHDLEAFSEGFGFEETPDQAAAIESVVADMAAGQPMDRLVCGDVGFGKTEVALRAAFVAVADRKQVIVLCPTTLLAEQHLQTFSDRFADWPIKLAELSRFRSSKETAEILKQLESGEMDIVIGTHKLLSRDVKLARLGLVIIDEEHRFGVRQKEALKRLRSEVDVLTLTATPIPRTLAMSLEGIRDFSVIATAPEKRLAIKTFVAPWSEGLIREAVMRELKRGGQVYFLHNEVDSIERMRERLARLLPEARIAVAHGQMRERDLERVMRDFTAQRCNVLLCSTIIETGIDIPTANTIVIHRADKFGLAQLHQLRGRVGRSHHQAYAYLLTPPEDALGVQARKRLEAIQMMEELGSGFYLAMHDLEIRGAGEILGESQSGEIQEVGFSLYARMLERAVRSLKSGRAPELEGTVDISTEVNLHVPALLPATYCSDVHERLSLYKRLADADSRDALDALREELVDRFGELPEPARALLECHQVRIAAQPLGVARIDATHEAVQLQFIKNPPLDGARVIDFIRRRGRQARLAGPERLRVDAKLPAWPRSRPGGERHPAPARRLKSGSEPDFPENRDRPHFSHLQVNLIAQGPSFTLQQAEDLAALAGARAESISSHAFRFKNASKNDGLPAWCEARRIDHAWMPQGRRFADLRLLAMDMDSTLITIECLDELGDLAGKKAEIASITAQAMRGELDYPQSLRRRVSFLAGLRESALERVYEERLQLTPGADQLIKACKANGIKLLLVSGGFSFFTERLKQRLGLDYTISNRLEIENGVLTGQLAGEVVGAEAKAARFRELAKQLKAEKDQTVAIGDGANDLKMMAEAGISVAFRAKPVVRAQASCALNWSGLDGVVRLFE